MRFVVAPLDVIKIRWQLQRAPTSALVSTRGVPTTATGTVYRGLLQTTQLLLREEGLRTLWRGNVPAMALYATYSSIQFSAFSSIMGDTRSASGTKDAERRMVAGAVAGVAATLATYPLDFMRTRLAAQGVPRTYTSLPHLISTVAREEGVRGFFKGVAPTCVQIAPYMALNFTIFGVLREALSPGAASDPSQHEGVSAVAGAVAGFTSKVAVYPLELAKRRLQVQGMQRHERYGTLPAYTGMLQCIRTTVREEGFAGEFDLFGFRPAFAPHAMSWLRCRSVQGVLAKPRQIGRCFFHHFCRL